MSLTDKIDAIFADARPYESPKHVFRRLVDRLVIDIELLHERVRTIEAQQLPQRPPYDPVADTTLQ